MSHFATLLGAFVLAGTQFGTVISLPLSGWLCSIDFDKGWPLTFYVPGIIAIIWLLTWKVLVYDNPQAHPRISEAEKSYILVATSISKIVKAKTVSFMVCINITLGES